METEIILRSIKQACINIAKDQPTPFYLFNLDEIVRNLRRCRRSWEKHFPFFRIAYSYKTNSLKGIAQLLRQEGESAEVVSADELHWAIGDGFQPKDIFFNGPVKLYQDLEFAIKLGVKIQIDSLDELYIVLEICKKWNIKKCNLALRLATNYRGIKTSRFGLVKTEFYLALRKLSKLKFPLSGLHFHVGSNINDVSVYLNALYEHKSLIADAIPLCNDSKLWLNLGGGFPSKSLKKDIELIPQQDFARNIRQFLNNEGMPINNFEIIIEPGRSLVEDFGYLATRVVASKKRSEGDLVIVDAGIHLARSIANWYHPVEFSRFSTSDRSCYTIYGSNCFESDIFGKNIPGPRRVKIGTVVIVGEVGGYDIPTANIWTKAAPAIYGLKNGSIIVMRKAQSWKDVNR